MTDKFIIESFWQNNDYGNCVSVAVIKAAMIKHGYNSVFSAIEKRRNYFIITLRNEKLILLSKKEILKFNKKKAIDFENYSDQKRQQNCELLKEAVELCIAVMTKYIKEYDYRKEEYKEKEAIKAVLNGLNTDDAYELLGISTTKRLRLRGRIPTKLLKEKALVIYNDFHAIVASGGYYDQYGTAKALKFDLDHVQERAWLYQVT